MRNYLTSLGIRYKLVGLHPKSKRMFWIYVKTKEFREAVEKWSE